jgi:hypothetical protein
VTEVALARSRIENELIEEQVVKESILRRSRTKADEAAERAAGKRSKAEEEIEADIKAKEEAINQYKKEGDLDLQNL